LKVGDYCRSNLGMKRINFQVKGRFTYKSGERYEMKIAKKGV
jgi:hypothetical protein